MSQPDKDGYDVIENQQAGARMAVALYEDVLDSDSAMTRVRALVCELLMQKHLENVILINPGKKSFRLLDFGCGTGMLLESVARRYRNAELVGVDMNAESLAVAEGRKLENVRFIRGSFDEAIAEGTFDFVVCSEVFEHLEFPDRLMDMFAKILKPGGHLSFSMPSGWMYRVPNTHNFFRLLLHPVRHATIYLNPLRNWAEAVKIHPAVQPSALVTMLRGVGLRTVLRRSSIWNIPERGPIRWLFDVASERGGTRIASYYVSLFGLLENLMNTIPIFRIFETRFVLMAKKER